MNSCSNPSALDVPGAKVQGGRCGCGADQLALPEVAESFQQDR
jgi:hypothetical protein